MTEIIDGIPQPVNVGDKYVKATWFATAGSGTTSGQITKPAGAGDDSIFIMDCWGTDTDALVSTMDNGKPTFENAVNAGGSTITTTFNLAGEYSFSGTPSPAGDHAVIFVYKCFLKNFNVDESIFESEIVPATPGSDHNIADHADTTHSGLASLEWSTAGHTIDGDIAMGTNKLTGLKVPASAGDSVRATATITEAALESVIAAAATKTTAAWNPTIGSGGDYATWALMIAGMPDLIAHAVTVTIEAGTTLTETCDLKNKHGILADGAITIQAEKYFPESSTVPTADSATATTLRDAALTTAAKGDDYFNGCWIYIIDGTGTDNGYVLITDYDDSDGDVFVASWPGTQPDNTSRYLILGALIDCAGTQELGLDIADCTCPLTFNGIGVDDSNNRGVEISRCFSVDMYWCGIYGSDRTGLFVQDSFLIDVRYSGIVNNNTDNNSVHSGIFFRAVARGTAITNGISDNNQRGVYLDAGSFGQMQANFGDGNGTWGTYAIQGAQAYMVGTECSGSSGNHSDAGTAGANSDDQAAAFT